MKQGKLELERITARNNILFPFLDKIIPIIPISFSSTYARRNQIRFIRAIRVRYSCARIQLSHRNKGKDGKVDDGLI